MNHKDATKLLIDTLDCPGTHTLHVVERRGDLLVRTMTKYLGYTTELGEAPWVLKEKVLPPLPEDPFVEKHTSWDDEMMVRQIHGQQMTGAYGPGHRITVLNTDPEDIDAIVSGRRVVARIDDCRERKAT